jgi:hypothetical protein
VGRRRDIKTVSTEKSVNNERVREIFKFKRQINNLPSSSKEASERIINIEEPKIRIW